MSRRLRRRTLHPGRCRRRAGFHGSSYHIAADRPDQVLIAAQQHYFDIIPDTGYQQASFTGINYARTELDFIVG